MACLQISKPLGPYVWHFYRSVDLLFEFMSCHLRVLTNRDSARYFGCIDLMHGSVDDCTATEYLLILS